MKHTTFAARQINATLAGDMSQFRVPIDLDLPPKTTAEIDRSFYLEEGPVGAKKGYGPFVIPFAVGDKVLVHKYDSQETTLFVTEEMANFTIQITEVRVERVRDISDTDAIAMGAPITIDGLVTGNFGEGITPRDWFYETYTAQYGPDAWDRDCVAAFGFEVVT